LRNEISREFIGYPVRYFGLSRAALHHDADTCNIHRAIASGR
jgi:hypothetical protein